jgi:hypothetical protein
VHAADAHRALSRQPSAELTQALGSLTFGGAGTDVVFAHVPSGASPLPASAISLARSRRHAVRVGWQIVNGPNPSRGASSKHQTGEMTLQLAITRSFEWARTCRSCS